MKLPNTAALIQELILANQEVTYETPAWLVVEDHPDSQWNVYLGDYEIDQAPEGFWGEVYLPGKYTAYDEDIAKLDADDLLSQVTMQWIKMNKVGEL